MKYLVTYEETLSRSILVDAENPEDAESKVLHAVNNEDIVLDTDDFCHGEVTYVCAPDAFVYDGKYQVI